MVKPDFPVVTARLLLRPFTPDDLDALHSWESRPDVARYLYWEARTREESRVALERKVASTWPRAVGESLVLAVQRRDTGQVIGDVHVEWLHEEWRQGEVGFVFHPDHGGRGYAAEAAEVVLRLGFTALGLHRIIGRCDVRNTASSRLMERLGMRKEAHFRHNDIFKGEWGEELVYAMLEDEL
ncbi:GNAT family N-acetyltransferase [Umezawaea tangerina]|uniref:GNAT family N-acetyltransferase n=1 Tax=Umezawaea tangerina TaxID=84725 RepID=UPI000D075C2D|nr:GNAT family N-acetyltransferase [Umezawaea tangerina]